MQLKWPETCTRWRWSCCYGCSWLSDVGVCWTYRFSTIWWSSMLFLFWRSISNIFAYQKHCLQQHFVDLWEFILSSTKFQTVLSFLKMQSMWSTASLGLLLETAAFFISMAISVQFDPWPPDTYIIHDYYVASRDLSSCGTLGLSVKMSELVSMFANCADIF